jgi:hypothetical protein
VKPRNSPETAIIYVIGGWRLADEYRRLSDLAITAQEHTDLTLADLGVQMDATREKLEQPQHILKEVE